LNESEKLLFGYEGGIIDIPSKVRFTKSQIGEYAGIAVEQLQAAGVKQGEIVALIFTSGLQFIIHFFALLKLEAIPMVLPKQTTLSEWQTTQEKYRLSGLLTDTIPPIRPLTENPEMLLEAIPMDSQAGVTLFLVSSSRRLQLAYRDVYLQPTSGTTGNAKICVRSIRAARMEAEGIGHALDFLAGSRSIACPIPISHAFGFGSALMLSLVASSELYLMDQYHPRILKRLLDSVKVDLLTVVPPMVPFLDKLTLNPHTLPTRILSAGSSIDQELYHRFRERTGIAIQSAYGTTETGKICIMGTYEAYVAGNVGRPLKHNRIRLVPKGEWQEIRVITPSLMEGYLETDGHVSDGLDEEGWFPTGDMGEYQAAGCLRITGRIKHMINVFGVKVNPLEVSAVLKQMPGIDDAHVYRGRHRSGSDFVQAVVSTSADLQESMIIAYCRERLSRHKTPIRVFIVPELPRTPTGKIIPAQLPGINEEMIDGSE